MTDETPEQREKRLASYPTITPEELKKMRSVAMTKSELAADEVLDIVLDPDSSRAEKTNAARAILPFFMATKKSVEHSGSIDVNYDAAVMALLASRGL